VSVVAVASVKASPGATTLSVALALTWPRSDNRRVRMVEADPDGGVVAARMGLASEPGMATFAVAARRGVTDELLDSHGQDLAEGVSVVAGAVSPDRMHAALASVPGLAGVLAADGGCDSVVDVGRLSSRSPVIDVARKAGLTLLVATPRWDEVMAVAARAAALRDAGCAVGLVCVGAQPNPPGEFAAAAGVDLVGVVGVDRRAAAMLVGEAPLSQTRLRRSDLWRHSRDVAMRVVDLLRPVPEPPLSPSPGDAGRRRRDGSVRVEAAPS
jgi:hypothetical protein